MENKFIEFDGGAKRSDAKPFYRKIPITALRRLAMTLAEGSLRYDKGIYHSNWRSGNDEFAAACFDHAIEHMYNWMEGDNTEDHLGHAMANIAFLIHFEETNVYTPSTLNYLPPVEADVDDLWEEIEEVGLEVPEVEEPKKEEIAQVLTTGSTAWWQKFGKK